MEWSRSPGKTKSVLKCAKEAMASLAMALRMDRQNPVGLISFILMIFRRHQPCPGQRVKTASAFASPRSLSHIIGI